MSRVVLVMCSLLCIASASPTPTAMCPVTHPYVYHDGDYCCETNMEGVNSADGEKCDGSVLSLTSGCCKDHGYTPCASSLCSDYSGLPVPTAMCPESHPFVYHNGDYCCKHNTEKVNALYGELCDGGSISMQSSCCKNDAYTQCSTYLCSNYDDGTTDPDTPCPEGYDAVSQNLDGAGKEWSQPHPKASRTKQECADICNARSGCTGFEFAEGQSETGACGTYTGGESNIKGEEDRLSANSNWRSCLRKASGGGGVPMEDGFCVKEDGGDQNDGVIKFNSVDGNTAESQQACLELCRAQPGATGCEVIWDQGNRGCYAHTAAVARGNGVDKHKCWIFPTEAPVTAPVLWRDDLRCGPNYPLPNGEPAQCNPDHPSGYVCCSPHAWCGKTDDHCKCDTCIDYSVNTACLETDTDYLGDDINACGLTKQSAVDCQNACKSTVGCTHFTFITSEFSRDTSRHGQCCLKNGPGTRRTDAPFATGLTSGPVSCCLETNVDYLGDDINSCGATKDSASDCQNTCQSTTGCTHFTFITSEFTRDTSRQGQCCLKNGPGTRRDDAPFATGLTSGPAVCDPPCDGGDSCCTSSNQCNAGEGDCDSNDDCFGEGECNNSLDNCNGATYDATDDCCACLGGDTCCTATNPCNVAEGDCDSDADCKGEAECNNSLNNCKGASFQASDDCCACLGGNTCCTPTNPCTLGEGDCDSDADCKGEAECNNDLDNCGGGSFDGTDDCCACLGGDTCCTPADPCAVGEGDCDSDADCEGSSTCGTNNCNGSTFDSTDDCCE